MGEGGLKHRGSLAFFDLVWFSFKELFLHNGDVKAFLNARQRHQIILTFRGGEEGEQLGAQHGGVEFPLNGDDAFHDNLLQQQFLVGTLAQVGGKGDEEEVGQNCKQARDLEPICVRFGTAFQCQF